MIGVRLNLLNVEVTSKHIHEGFANLVPAFQDRVSKERETKNESVALAAKEVGLRGTPGMVCMYPGRAFRLTGKINAAMELGVCASNTSEQRRETDWEMKSRAKGNDRQLGLGPARIR